jgi:hypothetical protein
MLVVEFVLIIRNFVAHVGDYFPYSKLVKNVYLSNFLARILSLTINAVFKWRIFSVGSKLTFGNCRLDDELISFFFSLSRSIP